MREAPWPDPLPALSHIFGQPHFRIRVGLILLRDVPLFGCGLFWSTAMVVFPSMKCELTHTPILLS